MTRNNTISKEDRKAARQAKYEAIMADLRNPVKRAVRGRKVSSAATSLFRTIIFIGLSFVILFPIFQQIMLSFRDPSDLNNPLIVWIPETWSVVNFKIAIALTKYWQALLNNLRVSTITTICQLACTSLAGYAFARLKFKGSNILFWLVMLTLIVPPQVTASSRSLFFTNFDIFGIVKLFNEGQTIAIKGPGKDYIFYIMAITGQGIRASLFIFLFRQFFRGVPVELEESAQIDGAGIVRTFWSVMLPNARGVITTVALFAFVWQWNDVYYTSMFGVNSSDFPLLTMQIINTAEWLGNLLLRDPVFKELVSSDIRGNNMMTSLIANTEALLMMAPILIAYLFVQKLFVEGIERTGIVG